MHALPRLSPIVLAQRSADERTDAYDGSWRVYVTTLVLLAAVVVAFACLSMRAYPVRAVYEVFTARDIVGAAATLAAVIAAVHALAFHHRATHRSGLATSCAIAAWLALVVAMPVLLLAVLVERFGFSA